MNSYPLLDQMIEDMQNQSELYCPTSFWDAFFDELVKAIKENGISNFRRLDSCLSLFVPTYAFPGYLKNKKKFQPAIDALNTSPLPFKRVVLRMKNFLSGKNQAESDYRALYASSIRKPPFTDRVSESTFGNPLEQFEFDSRKFSRSFLNYLLGINFLKKNIASEQIKTVMEIGGGFGSLGEILLGDARNDCFYMDVDIPPLAFVSGYYLEEIFGQNNIATYADLKNKSPLKVKELREKYKAVSLCAWQLPELSGKIDLFVNFISFQEMEPAVIENYCKHVRKLAPDFVLLRNLKEGKQKKTDISYGVETPITGKDYDRFFPDYELVETDTKVFGFTTEDGFHSELRLYKRSSK